MLAVLDARESLSTDRSRLKAYFEFKGTPIGVVSKAKSNIFLGLDISSCSDVALEDPTPVSPLPTGVSNIFMGSDLCSSAPVFTIENPIAAGPSLGTKTGVVPGTYFTGSPKKYGVEFEAPYEDESYTIFLTSSDDRILTYESKTSEGFTINANASTIIAGEVSWFTQAVVA